MKKAILILAALMLVVSGVAAVSAYEAHIINVTAHVENALLVDTADVDFGTVFPQEFIKKHRDISLSVSAQGVLGDQVGDLTSVNFTVFAEWKVDDTKTGYFWTGSAWETHADYYDWMGYFTWVGVDPSQTPMAVSGMTLIGPPLAAPLSAQTTGYSFQLTDDTVKLLAIAIDVPVFEGAYNPLTDPDPKPSGLDDPSWIVPDGTGLYSAIGVAHPAYDELGMDFGIDLKIQVTDITRVQPQ